MYEFRIIPEQFEVEERKFLTYFNYVCALSNFVDHNFENIDTLLTNLNSSKRYKQIQCKRKIVDLKKIESILRNSWFTEFQINQLSKQDSYLPIALHWIPVQAYYSTYLMIRAYFLSQNQDVSPNHQPTLNAIANEFNNRKELFTYPWILMCSGCDKSPVYINQIEETRSEHTSLLSNSSQDTYVDTFKTFLKTTREREIGRLANQYKTEKKIKRISSKARQEIINVIAPTTIYDCLYRLRIRSNYESADSFMFHNVSLKNAKQYQESFSKVMWANHLLFENLLLRYLSVKEFQKIVETFNSTFLENGGVLCPSERFEIIKKHYA